MKNKIADLFLMYYAKKMEVENAEKYELNSGMLCAHMEFSHTVNIIDNEHDSAMDYIYDLLLHRVITADEYDNLSIALSLCVTPGLLFSLENED